MLENAYYIFSLYTYANFAEAKVCQFYDIRLQSYLVTLLLYIVAPVGVWEMNMAAGFLHHTFYIVPSFSYHMWMISVWYVHLQRGPVTLKLETKLEFTFEQESLWLYWNANLKKCQYRKDLKKLPLTQRNTLEIWTKTAG